jgi:hypothetical protein
MFHVLLDGVPTFTSGLLDRLQSTGWVTLGQVTAGQHTITIQDEGVLGACNTTGFVGAWEGTLETELVAG